mmetsp:Transcript_124298/g.247781  ORF Transcript_124298/g.247781 Transcript_124298/m.247781 type:complete len:363 (+) Transcript_124298:35-1123(+)
MTFCRATVLLGLSIAGDFGVWVAHAGVDLKGHEGHGHHDDSEHQVDHHASTLGEGHNRGHGADHGHGHKHHSDSMQQEAPNWKGAYLSALSMSVVSFVGVAVLGVLHLPTIGGIAEYLCLSFAGSVLIADALLHLLPHALEGADHDQMSAVGISATFGCISLLVVPELCEWHQHQHSHGIEASGIANLVVEMLHNFVDGIAIALSFLAGPSAGLGATIAVAAHELPQELGDFMVLKAAGFPVARLLLWNFLASLTCVLGVAVAHAIGQEASSSLQRYLMAFTAGSFLTLALNMIYPQVMASIRTHHEGRKQAFAKLSCVATVFLAIFAMLKVGALESGDMHEHGHHMSPGHSHGKGHSHQEL